jgi:uncharacterized protein YndB with AHSA1/START domain
LSVRSVAYAGLTLAGYSVVDRVSRRSGVTDAEFYGSLPGDGVLPHPMIEWTRATTIGAPPEDVWPWLVQMGFGRGGWYTSERFDRIVWRLENLSAGQILPEWQDLQVGDIVPDGPDYAAYFRVVEVQPEEAIVYRSKLGVGHPTDRSRCLPVVGANPGKLRTTVVESCEGAPWPRRLVSRVDNVSWD